MKNKPCSWSRRVNIANASILSSFMLDQYNCNPNLYGFIGENIKLILKCTWKCREYRIEKNFWKRRLKMDISDYKSLYMAKSRQCCVGVKIDTWQME
jgi:hypothetical protein